MSGVHAKKLKCFFFDISLFTLNRRRKKGGESLLAGCIVMYINIYSEYKKAKLY